MTIKEFTEEISKDVLTFLKNDGKTLLNKLLELESISNWLRTMYGVELEITVKPVKREEGRFFGKKLLSKIK